MKLRLAAIAAVAVLAGCAGIQPAGRNAERAPPPPEAVAQAEPAPAPMAAPAPASPVAAPPPAAPAPVAERPTPDTGDEQVIVPGQRERQVLPPNGDPRSVAQRREDVRNWDTCVLEAQGQREADPTRPDLTTPEDYCSRALQMADRTAVPEWRLEGRRRP